MIKVYEEEVFFFFFEYNEEEKKESNPFFNFTGHNGIVEWAVEEGCPLPEPGEENGEQGGPEECVIS